MKIIKKTKADIKTPYWIECAAKKNDIHGEEWSFFRKVFSLPSKPTCAYIRFLSSGVCGLWINGEFVEASTARYSGRINSYEVTSSIKQGKNVIALKCGSNYFWREAKRSREEKGFWQSQIALELKVCSRNRSYTVLVTDNTWETCSYGSKGWNTLNFNSSTWEKVKTLGRIKERDYLFLWEQVAIWQDLAYIKTPPLAKEIRQIVGKDYFVNLKEGMPKYAMPQSVYEISSDRCIISNTNAILSDDEISMVIENKGNKTAPYIILDFGRTVVGYLEIEFNKKGNGIITLEFDYSETPDELREKYHERIGKRHPEWLEWKNVVKKLVLTLTCNEENSSYILHHRRAFRFVKLTFQKFEKPVSIKKVGLRLSCYPVQCKGYFHCSDELLNKIWKVGRYTLWVNMHQEYESCPRNEMLYCSGDGRMDGLIDFYVFGDGKLLANSLALDKPKELLQAYGLVKPGDGPNVELWDYPAWRIISVFDYYFYTGNTEFVKRNYYNTTRAMKWMVKRIGKNGLINQLPVQSGNKKVEWTCSRERLGEKTFLNALFYKALNDIIKLAQIVKDKKNMQKWQKIAHNVKDKVNNRLWSKEKGAYIDRGYDYVPQDGNALAVCFGVADRIKANTSLRFLKCNHWSPYGSAMFDCPLEHTRGGNKIISPFMTSYEVEAHFCMGHTKDAINLIRRTWGTMLKKGAHTFWEFSPNNEIDQWPVRCHGWSAGPTYLLPAYVVGIKPTAPGFRKLSIMPRLGNLTWVKGVVPTTKSLIACSIKKTFLRIT